MSGATSEADAGRARPLSGGLWSLISWLRRDDASDSSGSLSSVGSDRTVASFAFLAPDNYRHHTAPVLLPPPGPPTNSYKKRLFERNSRLEHDRDLTLHRKYGLFRGENGYDGFSLRPPRKSSENNWEDRERRATSECLQRRAAHVPGKRRAPLPPGRSATLGAPRRSRKRPAPQPPRRPLSELSRNTPIPEERLPVQTDSINSPLRRTEIMDYQPEKYVKKSVKDPKLRTEKSFLKQIFDSKKRHSVADTVPERILPSISELDKQAAEIIESCKLKVFHGSNEAKAGTSRELVTPSRGDMWFCTRCLRKYDDSVVTCGYCVTEQKMKLSKNDSDRRLANRASNHFTQTEETNLISTKEVNVVEEKQKLREMLKEIKDSLPKRPKHEMNDNTKNTYGVKDNVIQKPSAVETPTLRIGCKISEEEKVIQSAESKHLNIKAQSKHTNVTVDTDTASTSATETAVVTQPIVLQHITSRDIIKLEQFKAPESKQGQSQTHNTFNDNKKNTGTNLPTQFSSSVPVNKYKSDSDQSTSSGVYLNEPLKISSLLNSNSNIEKNRKISLGLPSAIQHQKPSDQTPTLALEAKPVVFSKLLGDFGLRDVDISTTSPAPQSAQKTNLTSREQTTQKPLKTTSTTQTSSNIISDVNPNTTNIKDKADNSKPINTKSEHEIINALPKLTTNTLCEPPTSTFSLNPGPSVENKESPSQNATFKASSEVPKLSPHISDNRQRNSAVTVVPLELHSRKRGLINQLEQSIAKGDEKAAADAAVQLAQLRLSCSVLSFSSQIVAAPSTSSSGPVKKTNESVSVRAQMEDIDINKKKHQHITQTKAPNISNNITFDNITATSSKKILEENTTPMPLQSEDLNKKNNAINKKLEKLNQPLTSNKNDAAGNGNVSIEVWIEDREAARGPIRMNMPRVSVMGDLRRQANASFGLAAHLQRWIIGRTLCTDDDTPLSMLAGPEFDAPFYLCLVEPDTNKLTALRPRSSSTSNEETKNKNIKNQNVDPLNGENKTTDVYAELVLLERRAIVPNAEEFECGVCMENYQPGQGAVLRECVHTFCMECLADVVKHSEEPAVSCPAMGCPGSLQEREIRALVSPENYERWLARGLAAAESGTRNAFHCRTADCQGWALCEPGVTKFPCPVCKCTNCVSCQAIHEGDTCEQYRAKQRAEEATNTASEETDEGTRAFLDTLISRGEALECPECSAIITKKWGCDWIKCSACKTEICWVTRGRRWGPAGRGDTSAGCRCGVDGKRCHPSCGYCH